MSISAKVSLVGLAIALVTVVGMSAVLVDAEGQAVYEKKCAMCHGKDGVGDTKAGKMTKTPNIITEDWKEGTSVDELIATLKKGLGKMKGYEGKMTDEELKAVAEYTIELCGKK